MRAHKTISTSMTKRTDKETFLLDELEGVCSLLPLCFLTDPLGFAFFRAKKKRMDLAIVTFNVRNANPKNKENQTDPIRGLRNGTFCRRCAWLNRLDLLVETLLSANADVIGLQEVLSSQFDFLSTSLAQEFDLVGVGRDDGERGGEFAPIAFRKEKFKCIEWGTIWISETPDIVGSKYLLGHGCCGCCGCCVAPCTQVRICTWARLKPRQQVDGSPCPDTIVSNTHLDSKSKDARLLDAS
jgi:hypothetical protein